MLKRLHANELIKPPTSDSTELDQGGSPVLGNAQVRADVVGENYPEHETLQRESVWLGSDTQAVLVSLMVHLVIIVGLGVFPIVVVNSQQTMRFIAAPPADIEDEFKLVEDIAFSEDPSEEIGANSHGDTSQALSLAPLLDDISDIPSPTFDPPDMNPNLDLNTLQQAVGLVRSDEVVKGMTGVGTTGTDGAVDRITYEILRSMEERPTLVVWFFDQSGSLLKRREEIRNRFNRIYEELGIVQRSREERGRLKEADEPLLTSVFSFGRSVNLLTPKPTADIEEIRAAIDAVELDSTGVERAFSALFKGVEKFKRYRSNHTGRGPERNVMFIAVTDERGDDANGLDATIQECRKFAIPVYVIGVPAPFGREFAYVKWVDPNPEFDQTPQWAQVDQGPESILPERVKLGYRDDFQDEPFVDSGFGPYALSRLAYETGGIYFMVHPNRQVGRRIRGNEIDPFASRLEYFFDPEVMDKYRPDLVSQAEYLKRVSSSPLRQIVVQAASLPRIDVLRNPPTDFLKRDEATFSTALSNAQRQAARVEPALIKLAEMLRPGAEHRDTEVSPRWLAAFDLALGTVLAHKVRAESYNAMLAKAKRGMKFEDEKSNTWKLQASTELNVGSRLKKDGELAVELLTKVSDEHKGTPWGLLAMHELNRPIGWEWTESFTDVAQQIRNRNAANNNNPRPPSDDQARMLPKPPPRRPIPKL